MKILLQFPEGLKSKAMEYIEKYKENLDEVYLSSSPCFGACDLALEEAKTIGADKIIHFGHSKFVTKILPIEVEYIEYHVDVDVGYMEKILPDLKEFKKIILTTTVQHIHQINKIKEFFESNGKEILIGEGTFTSYPGQILGCDAGSVTSVLDGADAILYIGDGKFHPLAIKLSKNIPLFSYNPYSHVIENLSEKVKKLKRKRKGLLAASIVSKSFGILVSTKVGQSHPVLARTIKKKLEEKGRRAEILIANTFDPYSLENFRIFDCYITTACPRISDDSEQFGKPILDVELFNELITMI